jgi:hypothetical protein
LTLSVYRYSSGWGDPRGSQRVPRIVDGATLHSLRNAHMAERAGGSRGSMSKPARLCPAASRVDMLDKTITPPWARARYRRSLPRPDASRITGACHQLGQVAPNDRSLTSSPEAAEPRPGRERQPPTDPHQGVRLIDERHCSGDREMILSGPSCSAPASSPLAHTNSANRPAAPAHSPANSRYIGGLFALCYPVSRRPGPDGDTPTPAGEPPARSSWHTFSVYTLIDNRESPSPGPQ